MLFLKRMFSTTLKAAVRGQGPASSDQWEDFNEELEAPTTSSHQEIVFNRYMSHRPPAEVRPVDASLVAEVSGSRPTTMDVPAVQPLLHVNSDVTGQSVILSPLKSRRPLSPYLYNRVYSEFTSRITHSPVRAWLVHA